MRTMNNARLVLANGTPLQELTRGNQQMISKSGDINAYNRDELIANISQLLSMSANGQVQRVSEDLVGLSADERVAKRKARQALLIEAMNDQEKWRSLGSDLAEMIEARLPRESLMRRLCRHNPLATGEVARVPLRYHSGLAVLSTGVGRLGYQEYRSKIVNVEEFEIKAAIRVKNLDLEQQSADLLDQAFNDGLEAIQRQEDLIWKEAADATVGVDNEVIYFGELTPRVLAELRNSIADYNIPTSAFVIANRFWSDIIGNEAFHDFFDPATKYDLAVNGNIGRLMGQDLITDGFMAPEQRVLNNNELYVVATPEYHATYTTRGGIRSQPADGVNTGDTSRGWLQSEIFGFVLGNVRSVGKAMSI